MINDWTKLLAFWSANDIGRVRLFGSYARGNARADSDVDLVVTFFRKKSLLDLIRIEEELSQRLNTKVDLVTEDSLSAYIQERVFNEAKVIYDRAG
jgi:uncharacterized protein